MSGGGGRALPSASSLPIDSWPALMRSAKSSPEALERSQGHWEAVYALRPILPVKSGFGIGFYSLLKTRCASELSAGYVGEVLVDRERHPVRQKIERNRLTGVQMLIQRDDVPVELIVGGCRDHVIGDAF